MKFQVVADDPDTCNQLADNLRTALKQLQIEFPVQRDATPGTAASIPAEPPVLAEDGHVIASGKIFSVPELVDLLLSLHGKEIESLRQAAERAKIKTKLIKGLLLTTAIVCTVLAFANEIRLRRQEIAREAARKVQLHFTEPVKMLYFYRTPRAKSDTDQELQLRRTAYTVYQDESDRNLFSVAAIDAGRPGNAETVRRYGVRTTPAVILVKNGSFRQLTPNEGEDLGAALMRTVASLP